MLILIARKTLKYLTYTALVLICGFFVLSFFTSEMCIHPPERSKMSEVMVMSSALKMEISEMMLQTNQPTIDVSRLVNTRALNCDDQENCYIKSYEVKNTGEFKIDAAPLKSVVAFIPTPQWNEQSELTGILWECVGHPAEYLPVNCRIDKSLTLKEKSCQFCH
jgi:hypothetical protein